jgi:hypothetical protein
MLAWRYHLDEQLAAIAILAILDCVVKEYASFVGTYSFFQRNQLILAFHVRAKGEIALGDELAEVKLVLPEKLRP